MKTFTQIILTSAFIAAVLPAFSQGVLFKDLVTGTETISSGPVPAGSYPESFASIGSTMYFIGRDKVAGSANLGLSVYKSDGTPAGTSHVKVIGAGTSLNNLAGNFFDFNGVTVFTNRSNGGVSELWRTDGTTAGTTLIKSFSGNANPNGNFPHGFCVAGTTLYFAADNGNGLELWKSDGTTAGTMEVLDLYPGVGPSPIGPYPGMFTSGSTARLGTFNNKVYFWGSNGTNLGLYVSDGTSSGTTFVKSITQPGSNFFKVVNNQLFFNDGGGLLWTSDGTTAGTATITGITGVNSCIVFNGAFYVSGSALYKTDGTAAGTQSLLSSAGSIHGANSNAFYMRNYIFPTSTYNVCDGTAAGTGTVSHRIGSSASFDVINNKMYTTHADSGVVQSYSNSFMWESDGTWAGTAKLGSHNRGIHVFNNSIFYQSSDNTNGNEPWIWTMGTTNPPAATSVLNNEPNAGFLSLFPNPADDLLVIEAEDNTAKNMSLVLLNALGQEVKRVTLASERTKLDVSDLPAGIYCYSVVNGQIPVKSGKIIIR